MRTELQTDQADVRRITHQQAMAAALGVLETQGARSLVMRRLAEALDVSLPTLYVVIGSKEQLVIDLVRRATGHLIDDGVAAEGTPLENSFEAFQRALNWLDQHRWFGDLIALADSDQLVTAYASLDGTDTVLMAVVGEVIGLVDKGASTSVQRCLLTQGFVRALLLADELSGVGLTGSPQQRVQLAVDVFGALVEASRPRRVGV